MRVRAEVEVADELRVERDERPGPPAVPGHEMRDEEVEPAVDEHLADVDRERHGLRALQPRLVAAAAERAAQVAAEEAERRERPVLAPRLGEDGTGLGVGPDDDAVVGQRARRAPRFALAHGHRSTVTARESTELATFSVARAPGFASCDEMRWRAHDVTADDAATTPRKRAVRGKPPLGVPG